MMFLYHTGLRIEECWNLIVHYVAHEGAPREELYLPSLTKTRKGRVIPLNDVAQQCVAKRMMQLLREKVGVSPKATPHTLRL